VERLTDTGISTYLEKLFISATHTYLPGIELRRPWI